MIVSKAHADRLECVNTALAVALQIAKGEWQATPHDIAMLERAKKIREAELAAR